MTTVPEKPEFVFVVNDTIGGIGYFNKNLINNTSRRKDVTVKLILVDPTDSDHARFPDEILADEVIRFRYSSAENRYAVLRRFHRLLGAAPGAIICNDGLEMEAIYEYGTNKTVYQAIHDFYNLRLAVTYGDIVDVFVSHTKLFRDVLLSSAPSSVNSYWIPQGVSIPPFFRNSDDPRTIRVVFTGRLVEQKGVHELYEMNAILKAQGVPVQWTVIGRGPLKEFLADQWKNEQDITFSSPDTNREVLELMAGHDIFLLPTRFEGSPVSILEALSVGLVPIVSDLPGGITENITGNIGRRIPVGDISLFAGSVAWFHENRDTLRQFSHNCRKLAEEQFDVRKNADQYFELFEKFHELKKKSHPRPKRKFGFRLDHKWFPNSVVSLIRKTIRTIK